jgi:CBS domain-containing protein
MSPDIPEIREDESLQRALDLLALEHVDELPVTSTGGVFVAMLDRRAIMTAYRRRISALRRDAAA